MVCFVFTKSAPILLKGRTPPAITLARRPIHITSLMPRYVKLTLNPIIYVEKKEKKKKKKKKTKKAGFHRDERTIV